MYSKTYNFIYLRAKSIFEKEEDAVNLMKAVYKTALDEEVEEDGLYAWLGKQVYALGSGKFRRRKEREADYIELEQEAYQTSEKEDLNRSAQVIYQTLGELPDIYLATLYALYYDHITIKEISSIMEQRAGVILNRINYSHKYFAKALEIYAQENGANVKFSVEAVSKAILYWTKEHALTENVANNIYGSICRELGVQTDEVAFNEEQAGLFQRVRECEDELEWLTKTLQGHQKKPMKKVNPIALIWMGVVALTATTIVLVFALGKQMQNQKPEKTPQKVEQETETIKDKEDKKKPNAEKEDKKEAQQEEQKDKKDNDYVIPDSNTRLLTKEELQGYTKEQLYYARNEIFARHGMIFGVEELDNYFSQKSWYQGTIPFDDYYNQVEMNSVEETNLSTILAVESEKE